MSSRPSSAEPAQSPFSRPLSRTQSEQNLRIHDVTASILRLPSERPRPSFASIQREQGKTVLRPAQQIFHGAQSPPTTETASSLLVHNESSGQMSTTAIADESAKIESSLRPISESIHECMRLQERVSVLRTIEDQGHEEFDHVFRHLQGSLSSIIAAISQSIANFENSGAASEMASDSALGTRTTSIEVDALYSFLDPQTGEFFRTDRPGMAKHLRNLKAEVDLDHGLVLEKQQVMTDARTKLLNLEYRLQTKQESLKEALETAAGTFPGLRDRLSIAVSTAKPSPHTSLAGSHSSESSTPPLLQEYWNSKANVQISQERLGEIDIYHEEGLASRELMSDQGEVLEMTDDEFKEHYKNRRQEAERELAACISRHDELKNRCEQEGYSLDPKKTRSSSSSASGNAHYAEEAGSAGASSSGGQQVPALKPAIQEIPVIELHYPVSGEQQQHNTVADWLDSIIPAPSTEEPVPVHEQPPSHEGASRARLGSEPRDILPDQAAANTTAPTEAPNERQTRQPPSHPRDLRRRRTFPGPDAITLLSVELLEAFDSSRVRPFEFEPTKRASHGNASAAEAVVAPDGIG